MNVHKLYNSFWPIHIMQYTKVFSLSHTQVLSLSHSHKHKFTNIYTKTLSVLLTLFVFLGFLSAFATLGLLFFHFSGLSFFQFLDPYPFFASSQHMPDAFKEGLPCSFNWISECLFIVVLQDPYYIFLHQLDKDKL